MNQQDETQKIFGALKEYRKKYNADFYCVILTPHKGHKITIPGNFDMKFEGEGKFGKIIEDLVGVQVLFKQADKI